MLETPFFSAYLTSFIVDTGTNCFVYLRLVCPLLPVSLECSFLKAPCFGWVRVAHLFSFCLCCPVMGFYVLSSVLWCPLRFPHKTMLCSSLHPDICWRAHVLFMLFVCSGVQRILRCVFSLFFEVWCALCCQYLWIVHFWLAIRYSLAFIWVILWQLF